MAPLADSATSVVARERACEGEEDEDGERVAATGAGKAFEEVSRPDGGEEDEDVFEDITPVGDEDDDVDEINECAVDDGVCV